MSLTKRESYDGAGGHPDDYDGYDEWLETLQVVTEDDIDRMAAQDDEYRRIKNAEVETGLCGQREDW